MKSVIRRRTSGRSSRGTTTRITFSPRLWAKSSTSNGRSRVIRPIGTGAPAGVGGAPVDAGAAELGAAGAGLGVGTAAAGAARGGGRAFGRGPAGARSGDLAGYRSSTGDPGRPTNPPADRGARLGFDR